uniref:Uncharacterized protein n=1 Tax=Anguilla anguilla TaxID=7936 RepID=A0A0E9QS80_ANGAN
MSARIHRNLPLLKLDT